MKKLDGHEGCKGKYFFFESAGYCNCPKDGCNTSPNNHAGGSGQLYEFTAGTRSVNGSTCLGICSHANSNSYGCQACVENWRTRVPLRAATTSEACPSGWTAVEDRCFMYNSGKRKYAQSVIYCKSQGGNIVSIHNDAENDVVMDLVKGNAFLGAESDGRGNWKWNDGTAWWQPASDKHDGLQGFLETRIVMETTDKKWHDWGRGHNKMAVVCSKDQEHGIDCKFSCLLMHRNSYWTHVYHLHV